MIEHIPRTWRAVCLAAALALAACGGGGDDRAGDDDRSDDRTTTTAAEDDATTRTDPAAAAPDGSTPAAGAPGGVGTQLEVDRTFTGEGSEAFCAEARALQESVAGGDSGAIDEASVTGQLAALTPPPEIAADWETMVSVQQTLASTQEQDPLAAVDQAQLDAYGQATVVIAAYLGDVCQLSLLG